MISLAGPISKAFCLAHTATGMLLHSLEHFGRWPFAGRNGGRGPSKKYGLRGKNKQNNLKSQEGESDLSRDMLRGYIGIELSVPA